MSDLHVVAMGYRFVSNNPLDRFGTAAPLSTVLGGFDLDLSGGALIARPRDHYNSVEAARDALEALLKAWAAHARLAVPSHDVRFEFASVEVIDRSAGGVRVHPATAVGSSVTMDASIARDNSVYPSPPSDLRTDPVVDAIIGQLDLLDARRTSEPTAANWVLTKVEQEFGGSAGASDRRRTAAKTLEVDFEVLRKIGSLGVQNDPTIGRKAKGPVKAFTANEQAWLRAVIVLLARQIGARNAGVPLTPQGMDDLPTIP